MATKRIGSIDIAKGIAILSIMVGHIGFVNASGNEVTQAWLYQFHVPIFFVIAGYFLNARRSFGPFVLQKAKRLLLPYLACAAAIIAGTFIMDLALGTTGPATFASVQDACWAALYGSGSWYNPTPGGIAPIGAIWFLPALFFALIIGRFCLKWRFGWLLTIPLALVCYFTARVFWLPFSLQSAGVGTLFIMFGHWLGKWDFMSGKLNWVLLLACACLFIIAGIYNLKLSLASLISGGNFFFSLLVAAGASMLVLIVSRLVDEHVAFAGRVLAFFGKGSLTVLCVHILLLDLGFDTVLLAVTGLSGNAGSALCLGIQIAIVAGCIPLFRKVPVLRTLFP